MRHLMLLRHASAESGGPGVDDHDRPLSPRGQGEAARLGAHLARNATEFSLILCSSAKRAVETATRVTEALTARPRLEVERDMYLATPREMLERLTALPDTDRAVLVIGHNPGIQALALHLASADCGDERARMASQFSAGSLAELELPIAHWADAESGGRLGAFTHPEDLVP
jgi:phosphohistidine phosphatase